MKPLQVFVGWDPREDIAWQVCRHSILSRTDPGAVSVVPLKQSDLRWKGLYTRPNDSRASTEFSLTRFLTPSLAGDQGFAVFMDCDFLVLTDIREVLKDIDPSAAISVVKHDYAPHPGIKMDGKKQYLYPRKNWSSFIVFNLAHPSVKQLTPDEVNNQDPAYLHRFKWASDCEIGALSSSWNHLVGWYPADSSTRPNAIHYTEGGPWFANYQNCDFASLWRAERLQMERHQSLVTRTWAVGS